VKQECYIGKATLHTALRTRIDTVVVPKSVGYSLIQSKMKTNLGCCPTLWFDLPPQPDWQIKASNFDEVMAKKRAATTCPELILYIDSARLHRERRYLVTHEDPELAGKIKNCKSFKRLCELTRDDNLNTQREARRNIANLVGEKESHKIAGSKPPAHVMERDHEEQIRPPAGMGYNVEKLIEATEIKKAHLKSKEDNWVKNMRTSIEYKVKCLKMLHDFHQAYDRKEVALELVRSKNTKTKKRLQVKKQQLADAEEALQKKKDELQKLHKNTNFEADLRASGRNSMMGSVDQRGSLDQARASFRASVDGIRASLNEGQKSYEERKSMRASTQGN